MVRARRRSRGWVPAVAVLAVLAALLLPFRPAEAGTLPAGFQQSVLLSGLDNPTAFQFAPDGRVFVAEKSGRILVFAGLADTSPTVFADLRTSVDDFWDRGLLGLALDPAFDEGRPYVYALYTYDAAIGGTAPTWNDGCPTPPGPTTDGCVVSGRVVKMTAAGDTMDGPPQVLVEDWCQQYPSHSVGTLLFGRDGALYAGGGDGASFTTVDYGQFAGNPCADPPGGTMAPPDAEGGALRSQSVRRMGGPTSLDGTIIRIDPDTGAALPGNPFAASSDPNQRRIVAYGLRNPFRFTNRPGTDQLWVGDVGMGTWEELDKIADTGDGMVENFGWPCYEGSASQPTYRNAGLRTCSSLYSAGSATAPVHVYKHQAHVVSAETCPAGGASISGIAFYGSGGYPAAYNGALFFADHTRDCIWSMTLGSDGEPDPSTVAPFLQGAAGPVYLSTGPGGDIYYADLDGGTVRRISYVGGNIAPAAAISASTTSGDVPLTVSLDGTASSDPDGDPLSYSWDLDGDGTYGDSTSATQSWTYATAGTYRVRLLVSDGYGGTDTATISITAGNTAPVVTISAPDPALQWSVGDAVSFAGGANDTQDGVLPPADLAWALILHHCPSDCHTHIVQSLSGVDSGSFNAPDHDYPSWLELRLTATDSGGLAARTSVRLDPQTVTVALRTSPVRLKLTADGRTARVPFSVTVIRGHATTVVAPTPQWFSGHRYVFSSWSDGGARTHTVRPAASATLRATYVRR